MSDTNLAQEATGSDDALTADSNVNAIADLLNDPETDLADEDQGQKDETEETASDDGEKPEAEAESEETSEEKDDSEDDGPKDDSDTFASDDAMVRLKDGSVIPVRDLKRGYLSQASFTRGTQENAREREALVSRKAEVEQHARELAAQRDFLLHVSQQFTPQQPDRSLLDQSSPNYDPLRYAALKAEYDDRVAALTQLHYASQAEQARLAQEQQRQQQDLRTKEAKQLVEIMPELKKPDVFRKFWSEAVDTMADYGYSPEELDQAIDHRLYPIFRDLAAYRRAKKQVSSVKPAMQSKPVLSGTKRMDPKVKISREKQARAERLRKTGDFDAGINALMDLDL